jgi:hypothetical protein
MRRNHEVAGKWIRIVAIIWGIVCVLGAVPRRGSTVQNAARSIGQRR